MAILGGNKGLFPDVMKVLMKQHLRLLFVSEDEAKKLEISKQPEFQDATAEIEFLSCEREGCWEADIIVITRPEKISPSLIQKIKEVATQKIILVFSKDKTFSGITELREVLSHSKVVELSSYNDILKYIN